LCACAVADNKKDDQETKDQTALSASVEFKRFSAALTLSVALAANIGGTATLIGCGPNVALAGITERFVPIAVGGGARRAVAPPPKFWRKIFFGQTTCNIWAVDIIFTARCTIVQSAVLRSHVVCPSVCDVGGS